MFPCLFCTKTYSYMSTFEIHLREHTNERPYNCRVCAKSFSSKTVLDAHLNAHRAKKLAKVECKICGKFFHSGVSIKRHNMRKHFSTQKRHSCIFCQKQFVTKYEFEQHLLSHIKERPYFCGKCDNTFQTTSHRKQHLVVQHGVGAKVQCYICSKRIASKSELDKHVRAHTNEKPFKCSVCLKSYKSADSLARHARYHTQEKPYVCETPNCGESFTHLFLLRTHELSHTGKFHKCSECTSSFRERCNLLAHIRHVHRNERRFPCCVCGKRFPTRQSLQKHAFTHSNELPFKCDICGVRRRSLRTMKTHLKGHSQSKLTKCPKCSFEFGTEIELSRHILKDHVGSTDDYLTCLFCGMKTIGICALETHIRTHTKETMSSV